MSEQPYLGLGVTKNVDSWFETGGKERRVRFRSTQFPWTAEQVELLRKLTDDGLSCSRIANELGTSRNSVIGKQHRLGIRSKNQPYRDRPKKVREKRIKLYPNRTRKLYTRKPPMIFDTYQPQTVDFVPLNIPFMEIETGQCRYIVGEPDGINTLYCGHGVVDGLSYCAEHARLCFTAAGTPRPNQGYWRKKTMGIPAKEMMQRVEPVDPDELGNAA